MKNHLIERISAILLAYKTQYKNFSKFESSGSFKTALVAVIKSQQFEWLKNY